MVDNRLDYDHITKLLENDVYIYILNMTLFQYLNLYTSCCVVFRHKLADSLSVPNSILNKGINFKEIIDFHKNVKAKEMESVETEIANVHENNEFRKALHKFIKEQQRRGTNTRIQLVSDIRLNISKKTNLEKLDNMFPSFNTRPLLNKKLCNIEPPYKLTKVKTDVLRKCIKSNTKK
jgi:hypothetical protein